MMMRLETSEGHAHYGNHGDLRHSAPKSGGHGEPENTRLPSAMPAFPPGFLLDVRVSAMIDP